jgi:putative endonuclease
LRVSLASIRSAGLVYYEIYGDMMSAITREKQMKKWNRAWKLELIEEENPEWNDLWDEIV